MLALGNITIQRIVELEEPFETPFDFFDEATPDLIDAQRHWLEPHALDPVSGKMILPVQSYLIRTPHHSILIDTCVGCDKTYRGVKQWQGRSDTVWLRNLAAAGVSVDDIDYVFCTHLHVDHCGWNTRLLNGRWVPTFPNAKYVISKAEHDASRAGNSRVYHENVVPIVAAGQALLVAGDFALDDQVWVEPTPGHTAGHIAVRIADGPHRAVMIGDMLHTPLQLAYPDWSPNFDFDIDMSRATRRRFLDQTCQTDTIVLTAHLPSPSIGHICAHNDRPFDFRYITQHV